MEAAIKEQVRKIVSDAIKLSYAVEYLHTVEAFRDLYSGNLSQISQLSCELEHQLKPLLGYIEVEDMCDKLLAGGEVKEYWKYPH